MSAVSSLGPRRPLEVETLPPPRPRSVYPEVVLSHELPTATASAVDALLRLRGATLTVTRGPDAGRTVKVTSPSFVIGSGPSADLRLSDASVSREHLRLTLAANGVKLHDQSKNGTRLGGLRVIEAVVTQDVALTLGQTTLSIAIDAEAVILPMSSRESFGEALGVSPLMRHLFAVLEQAAASDITVLLEGESGVGKDVLARAIHAASARKEGPFVVVDCGAIPPSLIESELFGHDKGAFTGATESRRGVLEEASGGTLFLDEIGELPLELQPKLLRALKAKELRPVGARSSKRIDVRVVAATNKKLAESVARGHFRDDLFYRLAVVRAVVPPLRDRPEDVVPIATAMLRRIAADPAASVPEDFASVLREYAWPGNVRELRNVMERFAVFGASPDNGELLGDGAGKRARVARDVDSDVLELPYHEARKVVLDRFESRYFPRLLERAGGVMAKAAELAQIARPSLYRILERLDLRRDD